MLHVLLIAALALAPSVPAIQDWWCDAIRKGCRELRFPRPTADRLCAIVEKGIEDGAVPVKDGYQRVKELAAGPDDARARPLTEAVFDDLRKVIDVRDRAKAEAYGSLPKRNRLCALAYAEAQARKSRGSGPAGIEAAIAHLQKKGGAPLRQLLGVDTSRGDRLDVHLKQFAADRRGLRERRQALFARIDRALKSNAPDAALDPLLSGWQELEDDTAHLDRAQVATVEEELTLAEKVHAARELLPMIDRGMRWASIYFKVRGVFTGRSRR